MAVRARVMEGNHDAAAYGARYEALRHQAFERHATRVGQGLSVLLRQGMEAWMDTWSELPAPVEQPTQGIRPAPCTVSDGASAAVVHVLAAMALGHIEEARL